MSDPFFNSVVLLVGNNNGSGTTFVDQSNSAHAMTANGNAVWDGTTAPTGLTASIKLDGTGDYLSTPDSADWAFGSGDFTMEVFVKYNVVSGDSILIGQGSDSTGAGSFLFAGQGAGVGRLDGYYTIDGTVGTRRDVDNTAWAPGTTNFHHVAWTRSGTSSFMFVDGVQHGATFNSGTDSLFNAALQLCVGADSNGASAVNGWMAPIRITKGVARYTANFTPPTLPLPTTAVDPPAADFSGTPLSGTAPLSVAFTDLSTNTPTSWLWEKNDGSGWVNFSGTPTVQNPNESFTAGTWSVRLTATNAGGSNTNTKNNYITSTAPVTTTKDTHDGRQPPKKPWYQRLEYETEEKSETKDRNYRDKLREDIKLALSGPQAEAVREELLPYAEPSESKPFAETIDIRAIAAEIGELVALRMELDRLEAQRAYEQEIREDDEEVMLLLL